MAPRYLELLVEAARGTGAPVTALPLLIDVTPLPFRSPRSALGSPRSSRIFAESTKTEPSSGASTRRARITDSSPTSPVVSPRMRRRQSIAESRYKAAVKAQRIARGWLARRRFQTMTQNRAAATIAAAWVGHRTRREMAPVLEAHYGAYAGVAYRYYRTTPGEPRVPFTGVPRCLLRHVAAVALQLLARSVIARRVAVVRRRLVSAEAIQRCWRRSQFRGAVRAIDARRAAAHRTALAVTRIAALWRGHASRKWRSGSGGQALIALRHGVEEQQRSRDLRVTRIDEEAAALTAELEANRAAVEADEVLRQVLQAPDPNTDVVRWSALTVDAPVVRMKPPAAIGASGRRLPPITAVVPAHAHGPHATAAVSDAVSVDSQGEARRFVPAPVAIMPGPRAAVLSRKSGASPLSLDQVRAEAKVAARWHLSHPKARGPTEHEVILSKYGERSQDAIEQYRSPVRRAIVARKR